MSNLLEQASLVMIPSGYKEDIVYSVIPTSGAGDLTFTRASDGTRIDSNGNVEVVPWNLLQYSENFTSGWITVNSSITANSTTAPNGTTTADTFTLTASSDSSIYQPVNGSTNNYSVSIYAKYVSGDKYLYIFSPLNSQSAKVWFDIQNGTVSNQSSGFTGTIENAGNGWYRCSLYNTNQAVLDYIQLGISTTNSSRILSNNSVSYIWGAQVNLGTLKPYFPTTDRLNVPRLTYQNGGGGCPSLLLEKQSTNLILQSEAFDSASWAPFTTGSGAVNRIANAATSPDGTTNADEIQLTRSALTDAALLYQQQYASNATYSRTIYLKAARSQDVGKKIDIWSYDGSSVLNPISPTLTADWQRIDAGTATGALVEILSFGYLSSNTLPTTSGTDVRFYAWGAQGEASSYATSYIPTTSSSATRVADACYKTGISSLIGQTEGSFMIDVDLKSRVSFDYFLINNTVAYYIGIGFKANTIEYEVVNNSILQSAIVLNNSSIGRFKIAGAYKANDFVLYVNGTQIGTDTSGSVPATNAIDFYYNPSNIIQYNQAILFPTRLTNSELAQLTGNQNYTINQAYESYGVASESPNCVQP